MSEVARETYGTGETGAFFFVGKEHVYADDLMRAKLGVPSHPDRKDRDEGAELDKSAVTSEKKSTAFSFSAISQRQSDETHIAESKRRHIELKDSPSF